ncbi:nucleotidyltransferase domain-containing protein [Paenibacillus pabuli]|uniref:DNA polymerase beta superfamily protein n=1 Tax=Paenibacillus pabuli TaxID=1472 RepID=UPI0032426B90
MSEELIMEVREFVSNKIGSDDISNSMIYLCQAGSHISGTNDETSDLDFRAISAPDISTVFGLDAFDHTKLIGGQGKINHKDDFDVEIYSPREFIKDAYYGEIIPFEMLHVGEEFQLDLAKPFKPLYDRRDMFLSKSVVRKYSKFIDGCFKKSAVPVKSLKREDKIQRATAYGYETKEAMNSIKCLRLMIELLDTGEVNLYRKDREELLDIKRGKYTVEEYHKIYKELREELESKLKENTAIPDRANYKQVNEFLISYMRFLYP